MRRLLGKEKNSRATCGGKEKRRRNSRIYIKLGEGMAVRDIVLVARYRSVIVEKRAGIYTRHFYLLDRGRESGCFFRA